MRRTDRYELTSKVIISSSPTTAASRIAAWFIRGDQRRFHVPCPSCRHHDFLRIDNLKCPGPGEEEGAYILCEKCGHHLGEADRLRAIEEGDWFATATGEAGLISFHLNILASPRISLAKIARQFAAAEKDTLLRRSFVNTALAEVFTEEDGVPLDAEALQARAEPVPNPLPNDVVAIVAGTDVQGDRLECTVVALHARNNIAIVLTHRVIMGDTSGSAPWVELDRLIGTTFQTADRRVLGISITAVDSNFSTDAVADFCKSQRDKSRRVLAVKGMAGFQHEPIVRGKHPLRGKTALYLVGVDALKSQVASRLRMPERGPGWIALPDFLDASYFAGLASEKLVERFVRGAPRYEWQRIVRKNEPFDCLVYATAVARLLPKASRLNAKPAPSVADAAERLHKASNSGAR